MKKVQKNKSKKPGKKSRKFKFAKIKDDQLCDDCEICKILRSGKEVGIDDFVKAFKKSKKVHSYADFDFDPEETEEEKELRIGGFEMSMRTADKDDLYYEAMELIGIGDFKKAESQLNLALELDGDYVQTYVGFVNLYGIQGIKDKIAKYTEIAFEKTLKKFKKWPREMSWYEHENRQYLRAIQFKAELYADNVDKDSLNKEKAIELYKLLLKLNPGDNQGIRYALAGLYSGITCDDVSRMFDEGNKKQNWNKLENMLNKQNKKYKFWKEPRGFMF